MATKLYKLPILVTTRCVSEGYAEIVANSLEDAVNELNEAGVGVEMTYGINGNEYEEVVDVSPRTDSAPIIADLPTHCRPTNSGARSV